MDIYDDYGNTMQAFPDYNMDEIVSIISNNVLNENESSVCKNDHKSEQGDLSIAESKQIMTLSTLSYKQENIHCSSINFS